MNRTIFVVSVLLLGAYTVVTRQLAKRDARLEKELWDEAC